MSESKLIRKIEELEYKFGVASGEARDHKKRAKHLEAELDKTRQRVEELEELLVEARAYAEDTFERAQALAVENGELRRASFAHCGFCGSPVIVADAVRIRQPDAPNPFCSMECAQYWGRK